MIEIRKIAHNTQTGKFKLSNDAIVRLSRKGHKMALASLGKKRDAFDETKLLRHDPILVDVILELGRRASADGSCIFLTEISSDFYKIKMFDGIECVKEYKTGDIVPNTFHIVDGDHLDQYDFNGLEERLASEEAERERVIEELKAKAAAAIAEREKKEKEEAKSSKKTPAAKQKAPSKKKSNEPVSKLKM